MIVDPVVMMRPVEFDAVALAGRISVMRELPADAGDVLALDAIGARSWADMLRQAARQDSRWSAEAAWRWLRSVCQPAGGFRAVVVRHADTLPPRMLMVGMKAAKEIAPVFFLGDPFVIGGKMAHRPEFMSRAVFVF